MTTTDPRRDSTDEERRQAPRGRRVWQVTKTPLQILLGQLVSWALKKWLG
ncbi:hypothetical protein [Amycolatopsis taiwanensis]|uniref:Uncharacterized protein n=1 Tax=Amycolatopsis taiwanensis TaxID=342230 RepID=A0A9W6QX81_9PSEU|nr:hypothetical protein [Amycolatopsis taiwanensis]GLY63672.1 hypothetical protein Atai01_02910 [Amycolatopsis taiwanensis]